MLQFRQRNSHKYVIVCSVLFLAGCMGRLPKKNDTKPVSLRAGFDEHENKEIVSGMPKQHATSLLLLQELGALCVDIPVPLDAYDFKKYVDRQSDNQSDNKNLDSQFDNQFIKDNQVSYKSYKTVAEIVDFYRCQMERLGWQFCNDFHTEESLLFFVKPDKKSIVSIRPYNKKIMYVFVFISSRVY